MQMIESVHNPKVKEWVKLQQKKYRQQNQQFIVEGEHLVEEALKAGVVQAVVTTRTSFSTDAPVYVVNEAVLAKLAMTPTHQDIMATVSYTHLRAHET